MGKKQYFVKENKEESLEESIKYKVKVQSKKSMTNSIKIVRAKNSCSSTSDVERRTSNSFLPPSFRKYFWDCPFDGLDLEKYPRFIAARILNFGDWKAVSWLFACGGRELVDKVVKNGRYVNQKTANFWRMMLHG